jgi:enoyl-CoA hydratase/carnithine racemase
MTQFEDYRGKYRGIALRREGGVVEIRIHDQGEAAAWTADRGGLHDELGDVFYNVARDIENRVVIITGTGDEFLTRVGSALSPDEKFGPTFWYRIWKEGKDLLVNLLDIEVPVIGAINGPAWIHAELLTMSDIVIASDRATLADKAHATTGTPAGDGVHIWWQMLLGPNRGRHFLLSGEEIGADEAKALGIVAKVVPHAEVNARAWEIARELAARNTMTLRMTRAACVQHIKRRVLDDLGYGLMLEGIGALARVHGEGNAPTPNQG